MAEPITALVTGSTQGIGAAIAEGLVTAGVAVVRHGLPGESPSPQASPAGLGTVRCDLAAPGAPGRLAARALELAGRIDVLVLCASVQSPAAWDEIAADDLALHLRVNAGASLELIQQLGPGMRAAGWGRVLAVGSVQHTRPHPRMLAYAASKSAQLSIVRTLAPLLAPDGITVNCLSPGVVDTPRNEAALSDAGYREQLVRRIPAGRIGVPADFTAAAVLLCSADAGYLTGQDIVIDGGFSLT